MKSASYYVPIATLGSIGYLPAPGTIATFATLPLMYLLRSTLPELWYIAFIIATIAFGFYAIKKALPFFNGATDPSAIVFDEFIGCLITFIALPVSWSYLVAGFALFRFFDISKIFGIRFFECIPGASGIIADDVVAAIFSTVILHIIYHYGLL
jgi:phosphatidylglycerophosphatase A